TPADINGMLSVVFVGPNKVDVDKLGTVFRIRKAIVWDFLLWLRTHNPLYHHIPLDREIMDQYADDGAVPGLAERVVYD
ncbi:hypothetical protein BJ138DRAFT_967959, partial [Hygrophoropsis aurantiaca]